MGLAFYISAEKLVARLEKEMLQQQLVHWCLLVTTDIRKPAPPRDTRKCNVLHLGRRVTEGYVTNIPIKLHAL
jgi:hypothetical protein